MTATWTFFGVSVLFLALAIAQVVVGASKGWGTVDSAYWEARRMGYRPDEMSLIPISRHGTTIGNFLLLWWIMGLICAKYWPISMSWTQLGIAALVGLVLGVIVYRTWPRGGDELSAHAQTEAGPIMGVQLVLALVIALIFFLFAQGVTTLHATIIAVGIQIYVLLNQHVQLRGKRYYKRDPLKDPMTWIVPIGAAILLGAGWARIVYGWW